MTFKSARQLTASEFEAVLPRLRLSNERLAAARKVMVEKQEYKDVAEEYGWTRNAISVIVRLVWEEHEKMRGEQMHIAESASLASAAPREVLPAGWEKATFVAPSELIAAWREQLDQLGTTAAAGGKAPGKRRR